jgi:hypothetical protein
MPSCAIRSPALGNLNPSSNWGVRDPDDEWPLTSAIADSSPFTTKRL